MVARYSAGGVCDTQVITWRNAWYPDLQLDACVVPKGSAGGIRCLAAGMYGTQISSCRSGWSQISSCDNVWYPDMYLEKYVVPRYLAGVMCGTQIRIWKSVWYPDIQLEECEVPRY